MPPTKHTFSGSIPLPIIHFQHLALIHASFWGVTPPSSHTFLAKSQGVNPPLCSYIIRNVGSTPPTPEPVGVGDCIIHWSPFTCQHSTFNIHHSSFIIHHPSSIIHDPSPIFHHPSSSPSPSSSSSPPSLSSSPSPSPSPWRSPSPSHYVSSLIIHQSSFFLHRSSSFITMFTFVSFSFVCFQAMFSSNVCVILRGWLSSTSFRDFVILLEFVSCMSLSGRLVVLLFCCPAGGACS